MAAPIAQEDDLYSEDEEILLFLLLLRRRRRRINRTIWTRRWIMRRQGQGAYANLIRELNAEDPEKFRQYHRLDRQSFEQVLVFVTSYKQGYSCHRSTSLSSKIASATNSLWAAILNVYFSISRMRCQE